MVMIVRPPQTNALLLLLPLLDARKKSRLQGRPCGNCGHIMGNTDFEGEGATGSRLPDATNLLGIGGAIAILMGLCSLFEFGGIQQRFGTALILLFGIAFLGFWWRERRRADAQLQSQQESRQAAFHQVLSQVNMLQAEADYLREVLKSEREETATERSGMRIKLLDAALQCREDRLQLLTAELWARDVQLWLNQVEGFLAEDLPKMERHTGAKTLAQLRILLNNGRQLKADSSRLTTQSVPAQRARVVLEACLSKGPDLEDRVRDAQVLAAVGEGADLPAEFNEGSTWLHWLQEAIPSIELLPVEFKEDEAYLRVQAELRLQRDGAKYQSVNSLEAPTIDPGAIGVSQL